MLVAALMLLTDPAPAILAAEANLRCILERIPVDVRASPDRSPAYVTEARLSESAYEAARACTGTDTNYGHWLAALAVVRLRLEHIAEILRQRGIDPGLPAAWFLEQSPEARRNVIEAPSAALDARMRAGGVSDDAMRENSLAIMGLVEHLRMMELFCRRESDGQYGASWPLRSAGACG